MKFSKWIVIIVVAQAFLYTWVHLVLSYCVGMEVAPTTSVAFFGFCGAEAGLLAWIRKLDKSDKQESEENIESIESEEEYYEQDFSETDEP